MLCLALDPLTKRDDRIVGTQCRRETIDVGELSVDHALICGGERVLVAGHDLLLELEQFAIAIAVSPIPRRPLHLHAG